MAVTKKFDFTMDRMENAAFNKETRMFTFEIDGVTRELYTEDENSSQRIEDIEFSDGSRITLADLANALNAPEAATAAGPAAGGNAASGGSGEYADDADALVDGIDRLDSLGTDYWDRMTEAPEFMQAAVYGDGGTTGGGGNDNDDLNVPGDLADDEPVVPGGPGGGVSGNAVVDFAETNQVEFFTPGASNSYDDTNGWNLANGWETSNTTLVRTDAGDPNTVVITTKPGMSSTPTDLHKTFTAEEMGDGIRFTLQCSGMDAKDALTITLNGQPVPVSFDENGFAYISIYPKDYAPADGGDYTLAFGLDKGSSAHIVTVSDFVAGDPLEPPVWASGNVLANDTPSGGTDIVGSFILDGRTYVIDGSTLSENGVPYVRVDLGSDVYFTMDAKGNYTYEGSKASSRFPGPLDVTYTGSTGEATLHLRDNIVRAGEDDPAGSPLAGAGGEDALVANDAGLILEGRAGSDLLYGGAGDDTLFGGSGSDILYGGGGSDTFAWSLGDLLAGKNDTTDVIKDWNLDGAQDVIDLSSLGLQAQDIHILKVGDDIKLYFDNPVYAGRVQEIVIEGLGAGVANQSAAEQMVQDMMQQQQIKLVAE